MKKAILAIIILSAVCAAQSSFLTDLGCEERGDGFTYCLQPSFNDLPLKFVSDLTCYSSYELPDCGTACLGMIDVGCFGEAELLNDEVLEFDYYKVLGNKTERVSTNKSYSRGDSFGVILAASSLSASKCSFYNGSVVCRYNGESYDVSVSMISDNEMAILEIKQKAGLDLISLLMSNIIYIALLILIVIALFWAFRPKTGKPLIRLKKKQPAAKLGQEKPKQPHFRRGKAR
jgi:hypothetical protein